MKRNLITIAVITASFFSYTKKTMLANDKVDAINNVIKQSTPCALCGKGKYKTIHQDVFVFTPDGLLQLKGARYFRCNHCLNTVEGFIAK